VLGASTLLERGVAELGAFPDEVARVLGEDGLGIEREMDVRVGAHELDELDVAADPCLLGSVGRDRRVFEALGSDAEHERSVRVLAQARTDGNERVGDAQLLAPEARVQVAVGRLEGCLHEVHRRRSDEAADEQVDRIVVQRLGLVDLLEDSPFHDRDPVAHGHGFGLVVRDVDRRRTKVALNAGNLGSHLDAQLGIEIRQRLVHQERAGLAHDGAAHGDALTLAARKVPRLSIEELFESENVGGFGHAPADLAAAHLVEFEAEAQIVRHRQMRVERVVLEDHRDVAILRRDAVDDAFADPDMALGDRLEPGHHAERRGLTAAGRPDQHHELAVRDLEAEIGNGEGAVVVDLRDLIERDAGHPLPR
jgi:hypothetical protein